MTLRLQSLLRPLALLIALVSGFADRDVLRADLISYPGRFADFTVDSSAELIPPASDDLIDSPNPANAITPSSPASTASDAAALINFPPGEIAELMDGALSDNVNLADTPAADNVIACDRCLKLGGQVSAGGNVRGQVVTAPEPAGVVLAGITILICGAIYIWPVISRRNS